MFTMDGSVCRSVQMLHKSYISYYHKTIIYLKKLYWQLQNKSDVMFKRTRQSSAICMVPTSHICRTKFNIQHLIAPGKENASFRTQCTRVQQFVFILRCLRPSG